MKTVIKKVLSVFLAVIMFVGFIPIAQFTLTAKADTWNGTYKTKSGFSQSSTTYTVSSAQGLAYFIYTIGQGTNYSGCTINLTVDVDMNNTDFALNVWSNYDNYFKGTFNGNSHTISNFKMSCSNHRAGMFRSVDGATFKNITFKNANISYSNNKNGYGVLVGYAKGTCTFENIKVTSGTVTGYNYVGGIVGEMQNTDSMTFKNCSNAATIVAKGANAAGIAARFDSDNTITFTSCTNTGSVTSSGDRAGGMCAHCKGSIKATSCTNSGTIKAGSSDAGGIVGWVEDDASTFNKNTNSGSVTGASSVGGIMGYCGSKDNDKIFTFTNNTNTGAISSDNNAGGIAGVVSTDAKHIFTNNINRGTISASGETGGGICAVNKGYGTWTNNYNYGKVRGYGDNAGGILGEVEDDANTFTNCYNSGYVNGENSIGGILGYGEDAVHSFTDCGNSGGITSSNGNCGGISGYNDEASGVTFTRCWNVGTILAYVDGGGICGKNYNHTIITKCWNGGEVKTNGHSGNGSHGGIIGYTGDYGSSSSSSPCMTDCYNWGNVSGGNYNGGLVGYVKDGDTYYITYSYNAAQVSDGNTNKAICANGGNVSTAVYYNSGKTVGTKQGTAITDANLKSKTSMTTSEYIVKNTWGVTIGSTTYYYPVLTWYRNLFKFNITFSDSYSSTNKTESKLYNASFTPITPSRTGYTFKNWYDTTTTSYTMNGGTAYTAGVNGNTQYYTVTQETSDVQSIHADRTSNANWTAITYYVAYNGNGSTSGSMSNSTHTYDTAKNLTANAYSRVYTVTYNANTGTCSTASNKATATFNGWSKTSTGSVAYANKASVKNLTSKSGDTVTLYANWTLGSVTLPTPTKTGYQFAGWYTAASGGTKVGAAGASYTPSANTTLYAQWTANSYYVSYNGNGSTSGSMSNSTHTYDTASNLTANAYSKVITVTYDGNGGTAGVASNNATASFSGWATSASGDVVYANGESVLNLTSTKGATFPLYAKWTLGSVSLPSATRTGYTFNGWYTATSGGTKIGAAGASYTPSSATTLYAQWTVNQYDLKINPNSGSWNGSTSISTITKEYGTQYTVAAPTRTGYTFKGWSFSGTGSYADNVFTFGAGTGNLVANWEINTYSIGLSASNVGYTVSTAPAATVTHGGSISFAITLDTGYTNSAIPTVTATTGNVSSTQSGNVITYKVIGITGNTTVSVGDATKNTYTVIWKNFDGTVLETDTGVTHGTVPTYDGTAPTKAYDDNNHYAWNLWDKTVSAVTGDTVYTANFTTVAHSYTATVVHEATCAKPGETSYLCSCGRTYTDNTTPAATGLHDYVETTRTPATCSAKGIINYECSVCKATTTKDIEIDANAHNYGTFAYDGETAKTHTKVCSYNNDHTVTEICNFTSEITTEPTCTTEGVRTYTCTVCGGTYTEAVEKTAHVFDKETVDAKYLKTKATCESGSVYYKSCVCGLSSKGLTGEATFTADDKLEHSYTGDIRNNGDGTHSFKCVNGCNGYGNATACDYVTEGALVTDATCITNAVYTYSCACGAEKDLEKANTTIPHSYTGVIKDNGDGTHSFKCVNGCDGYGNATACSYTIEGAEVTAATCVDNAVYTYSCACGAEKDLPKADTKLEHDFSGAIKDNGDGTHSYKCVNGCDDYGNATACDYVNEGELVTAATCLANAVYTYSCECGAEKNNEKANTKLDHDFSGAIKDNGDGTHSFKCVNGCDDYGNATACDYVNEGELVTAATCLANAVYTYSCECGAEKNNEKANTKLDHDFSGAIKDNGDGTHSFKCVNGCDDYGNATACDYVNEGELVTAATCLANAVYTYSCECGAEKNNEKANTKLDHDFSGAIKNNGDGTHSYRCVNGCDDYGDTVSCTSFSEKVTAPTCTAKGFTTYTCKDCGYEYTADETEMLAHTYNVYVAEVTAATCLKNATATYKCENCTATTVKEVADTKLDHDFSGELQNNGDGTHSFKCVNGCDDYGNETACDYVNEGELVTAATCLANAVYTYSCECGAEKDLEKANTKLDHDYSGAIKDNGDGTHSFKCVNGCDDYGNETACDYVNEGELVTAATCLANAVYTYSCECGAEKDLSKAGTKLDHDFSGAIKDNGDGTHSFKCVNGCDDYGNTTACDYVNEGELVTAATCLADAVYTYSCACGAEKDLDKAGTKLDHSYTGSIKNNSDGTHSYKCVNGCDDYGNATACSYTIEGAEVTAATCLADAVYTYSCACGAEKDLSKAGTKLDHDFSGAIKDNGDGTHSFKCVNGCDEFGGTVDCAYTKEGKLVTAATCLKNAVYTYACECGAEKDLEKAETKLEHSYTGEIKNNNDGTHSFKCVNGCDEFGGTVDCAYTKEGKLVTAATCLKNAVYTYACECGAEKDLEKAETKLDHSYTGEIKNNGDGTHSYLCKNGCNEFGGTVKCSDFSSEITTPATCTEKGITTYTCKACGYSYTLTDVDALGHDFVKTVVSLPTCVAEGLIEYKCSRCPESYTEAIEKEPHTPGTAVVENRVYGSGDEVGHYESVVYCTECGTELSRTYHESEGDCPACPLVGVAEELGTDTALGKLVNFLHTILHTIFKMFDNVIGD